MNQSLDTTSHLGQLLDTHRRTIEHYVSQRAVLGTAFEPPYIMHGIREACESIRKLKDALREQGIDIQDHPHDNADLESFSQDIGVNFAPSSRYTIAQYEAYCDVWQSLQLLRGAGDNLWRRANRANISVFAQQLRETDKKIQTHAIFLEEDHYEHLKILLKEFGDYRVGKARLVDIRSREDEEEIIYSMAEEQIGRNRKSKEKYEALLEKIRTFFQSKLAEIAQMR